MQVLHLKKYSYDSVWRCLFEYECRTMVKISSLFILIISLVITSSAIADEDDYDEVSYDSLVSELSRISTKRRSPEVSSFADVKIHVGVAFISTLASVSQDLVVPQDSSQRLPDANSTPAPGQEAQTELVHKTETFTANNSGVQISLGIDLFSRYWLAEGSLRNFGDFDTADRTITLKEFDIKVLHKSRPYTFGDFFGGLGLSARYLDVYHHVYREKYEFATPSAVMFLGINTTINDTLSLGAEVSRRTCMIAETIDKESLDLSVRADFHF